MSERKQTTGYQRQKLTDAMVRKAPAKEKDYWLQHFSDQRTYALHQKAAAILRESPDRRSEVNDVLNHRLTLPWTQAAACRLGRVMAGIDQRFKYRRNCRLNLQTRRRNGFLSKKQSVCLLSDEQRMEIIRRFKYDYE